MKKMAIYDGEEELLSEGSTSMTFLASGEKFYNNSKMLYIYIYGGHFICKLLKILNYNYFY